ncbi:MAG: fluoride efflux transporter CrcB [Kiloniellaceae bacterium]|jgi:CrcB protein|nr:fluoride efflux transporter CrcB [Kiloniellaceae bacterium]
MQIQLIAAVACGGALGAVGRYFVIAQVATWTGHGFPFGTLAVNVVGSFAMGVLVEVGALAWSPSPELRAFLTVGFLGAFTTFSTFSMETILLYERGDLLQCAAYVAGSVLLSVGGFFAAMFLLRTALT